MSEKSLFEAFKRGFYEGMVTIISVCDLPKEDMKEKLHSISLIDSKISELYNMWMGF